MADLPLGLYPDSLIAEQYGLNRRQVTSLRARAGIAPFAGSLLTQEGDTCRSIYEAKYDAYLHWKLIPHQHQPKVPGLPFVADFLVGETYVEIVGMLSFAKYARKLDRKWRAYDANLIPCRWIEPGSIEYLCRDCPVPIKVNPTRHCRDCGKLCADLVGGRCRGSCYMKAWRRARPLGLCENCKKEFPKPADDSKFCCRRCYWVSLVSPTPNARALYARRYRARKGGK